MTDYPACKELSVVIRDLRGVDVALSFISYEETRTLVKSMYRKFNFLISQPKHMLWVLKTTVSMRWFL